MIDAQIAMLKSDLDSLIEDSVRMESELTKIKILNRRMMQGINELVRDLDYIIRQDGQDPTEDPMIDGM